MFKGNVGDRITYHDHTNGHVHEGDVTFITNDYIVLCIHRELKTPEEAHGARSKWREVKILVFKYHYHQLTPLNSNVNHEESPIHSQQD